MEQTQVKKLQDLQYSINIEKVYNALYLYAISIIISKSPEIDAEQVYKKIIEYAIDTFVTINEAELIDIGIKVMDAITKDGYEKDNYNYVNYPLYKTAINFDSYGKIIPIYQTTLENEVIDRIKVKVKETNTDTN